MQVNLANRFGKLLITGTVLVASLLHTVSADARTRLEDLCHIKGQEENHLHGVGLVVGLAGTGDGKSSEATIRSLATVLQLMDISIGDTANFDASNVALVSVTATVPRLGARQGSKLNCQVSSISGAKSLAGGTLLITPLLGPRPGIKTVFAISHGLVQLDKGGPVTFGRIQGGCQLEHDFFNEYIVDGKFTLVIDKSHASWQFAQDIAEQINNHLNFRSDDRESDLGSGPSDRPQNGDSEGSPESGGLIARVINATNVVVPIPDYYADEPVAFIADIMSQPVLAPQVEARVMINERTGIVVISGDVEIGEVAISVSNVTVQTGDEGGDRFVALPKSARGQENTKLKSLVDSLNSVHVSKTDIIEIIKQIEKAGKLHGKLSIN